MGGEGDTWLWQLSGCVGGGSSGECSVQGGAGRDGGCDLGRGGNRRL